MKRAKKINKKLDPVEESSDDLDSDEEPTQPIKKGKGNKTIKMPTLSSDPSDSDEVPTPATKKGKAKGKKTKTPKPEESDSEEKPKQAMKNVKGKGKKPTKLSEPVDESSNSSDSDEASSPAKTRGKGKANKSKIQKKVEESSHNSDSEEKPSQTTKKRKGKKVLKKTKPEEESSDSAEKPKQIEKKVKRKKSNRTEPVEETSDDSDSDEKQTQIKKKVKGKKASTIKPVEEHSDDSDSDEKPQTSKNELGKGKKSNKTPEPAEDASDSSEYEPEPEFNEKKHKESLHLLSRIDGDFYDFLEEHNTELLKFDDHENALADKDNDDDDDDDDDEKVHTPGDLHGDSDESDFEAEDAKPIKGKVTLKMVKEWEAELQKDGKMKLGTFTHVVKLFNAAVSRATSEDGTTDSEYSVAGSSVFNAVLNMCVVYLPNAVKKYLGTEQSGKDPQKCKHFVKIKGTLVQYLTDLLKLLSAVTSDNILITMLKHLHQMSKYVACFTRIAKQSIKKLLPLWSTGDETVRVLAFMCILRITRNQQKVLLQPVLKAMFMTYVKNCKFVSPSTWPGINFMRRSLVEMFSLDLDVAYPLVFLYVRQLGIHLRNAVVVPKLEHRQAVHNWQYLNSLHLWAEVVTHNIHHKDMKSLHFPLVMIVSNTIKLGPTQQFYPMRFFLIEMLMNMRAADRQFLPIMALFVDVLTKFDINKKPTKVSMKPMDFSCIIRLSKSQMNENGFKDTVVDRLYALLLEYTASISYNMSFPDVCVILILFLGELVSKCNVANYTKKLKQLLDKVVESSNNIYRARAEYTVSLVDFNSIKAWERRVKAEGTPLAKFYENWSKLNKIQKRKNVTKNDELAGAMPMIKRPKISEDAQELVKINRSSPVTLFPSDSEDDSDLFKNEDAENVAPPKEKKIKKKELPKKKINKQKAEVDDAEVPDAGDIVQEFSASDW